MPRGTPAQAIEQRLGFVVELDRLLADTAAAQRVQPLVEAVFARRFAVQALHHLAGTPTHLHNDADKQSRCQQEQQRAQQHGQVHRLRNIRHSATQPNTWRASAPTSIVCPELSFHMPIKYFGLDTRM
ncbi:hypothetical protein D3C73_1249090 [compost metagenome]